MKVRALTVHVVQFWLFSGAIISSFAIVVAAADNKPAQIPIKNLNVFVRIILVSLAALGWSPGGPAWAGQIDSTEAAATFIETLGQKVLPVQASKQADATEVHLAALHSLIRGSFDLDLISRLVLGKFWGRATEEQRAEFKDLFTQYLLNTYAGHLNSYRADTLVVISSKRAGERDYLVRTSVERDKELTAVVWRLRAGDGDYRIIDVLFHGISLNLTHRNEFASVVRQEGLDGMLRVLRDRVSRQADAPDRNMRAALPASILVSPNASKIDLLLLHQK
jgi:phospholipid transport system substrate-binding protein